METRKKIIGRQSGRVEGNLSVEAVVYANHTAALRFYNNEKEGRVYTSFCETDANYSEIFDMITRYSNVPGETFVYLASSNAYSIKENATGVTLLFFAGGVLNRVKTDNEGKTVELKQTKEIKIKGDKEPPIKLCEQNCFNVTIAKGDDPNFAYALRLGKIETHKIDDNMLVLSESMEEGYARRFRNVSRNYGMGLKIDDILMPSVRMEGVISSKDTVGFKELNIICSKTVEFDSGYYPSVKFLRGYDASKIKRRGSSFELATSAEGKEVLYSGHLNRQEEIQGLLEISTCTPVPSDAIKSGANLEFDEQRLEEFARKSKEFLESFKPLRRIQEDKGAPKINMSGLLIAQKGKDKDKDRDTILPSGDIMRVQSDNKVTILDGFTREVKAYVNKEENTWAGNESLTFIVLVCGKAYQFRGFTDPEDPGTPVRKLCGSVNGKDYTIDIADETGFDEMIAKIKGVAFNPDETPTQKNKAFRGRRERRVVY